MLFQTLSVPLASAALATNSTAAAFATIVPLALPPWPTTDGIHPAGQPGDPEGSLAPNRLFIVPYCLGAAGQTFALRLWALRLAGTGFTRMMVPELLVELACTACAVPGVANGIVGATSSFCDTITVAKGAVGLTGAVVAPGSNLIAHALVELKGAQRWQFDFQLGNNPPTSMNALWARA